MLAPGLQLTEETQNPDIIDKIQSTMRSCSHRDRVSTCSTISKLFIIPKPIEHRETSIPALSCSREAVYEAFLFMNIVVQKLHPSPTI